MNKFLFTDETNGVIEVQSAEELENLLAASGQPDQVRIWLFSSHEWISYAAFRKQFPFIPSKEKPLPASHTQPVNTAPRSHWIKRVLYFTGAAAGIFLVFNFTQLKWEKAGPLTASAARPANMPQMDIDSLIGEIEFSRGQSIDRNTRNNLRLRNTWPDRILLQLNAERETNGSSSRFFNVSISIDNTTGYPLDNAVVRFSVWKNKKLSQTDTVKFGTIRYDKLAKRELANRYRGDSLSVAFESVRAKAFNFCYSATVKNNSGNYYDRWFCRE
jgi:hypothetical protein